MGRYGSPAFFPRSLGYNRAPLLPPTRLAPRVDVPVDDRAALTGILFRAALSIPWEMLPAEMNCGCGKTAGAPAA